MKRSFSRNCFAEALALALLFSCSTRSVLAATISWSNAPSSSNWNTATSWAGGVVPVAGSVLQFSNSSVTNLFNNITAGTSFAGISFTTNASIYFFSGNSIVLTGGITNSGANLQTINLAISTTANQTISTSAGGGNITLGGIISGAGGGITAAGNGTTTLTAINTFTGATAINAGSTLQINGAGQLGSGNYAAAITNNGALIEGSSANQTVSGILSGTGSLVQSGTGTLTLSGTN